MKIFRETYNSLIQAALPPLCVVCRQPSDTTEHICETCHSELERNLTACTQCGIPLHGKDGLICGHCQIQPPGYDHSFAPLLYQGHVRELVINLKFNEKLVNSAILSRLFINHVEINKKPDLLIPVPLHSKRIRERGYNQAQLLAKELSKHYSIDIDDQSCQRIINTERQSDLPLAKKHGNVKGAFICESQFDGQHIAIIVDVMTSGHTVNELARKLKRQGASQIDVWVMARAGKGTN